MRAGEVLGEAVGLVIGERELANGNLEADVAKIVEWGEAVMGDFVDVEGELGLHVLVGPWA